MDNGAIQIGLHRFLNAGDVSDDGLYSRLLHAFKGSPAHASAKEHIAITDGSGHDRMTILASWAKAMSPLVVQMALLIDELLVAHFVPHLLLDYFIVLDGKHSVGWGSPKMLADCLPIIGDRCDSHI
jgi:hypothetical protein